MALPFLSRQSSSKTPAPAASPQIEAPPPLRVPEIKVKTIEGAIQPGDTITGILGEYFSPREIHQLSRKSRKVFPLSRICAGQPYKICLQGDSFTRFEYDIDRDDQLIIRQGEEGFDVQRRPIEYRVETDLVRGTIESSLFEAVAAIGENPELALALAEIFAWDIDFLRDIRAGDSFQVLIEHRFRDGEPAGYGRILAAEFTNQGETFRAFLFRDGDQRASYYDEEGDSLRKTFLRAPLSYTRISSGFTWRRYHPISKTWKAHPAIDYAAPSGTPIKAVGDGVITRAGYSKYNGNHVKIRHNGTYDTLYLHMTGFARGIKRGKRVIQGQTIGYVGSTGLATGPHLCFRMYKNGQPVNPNRVQAKPASPVSSENRDEFQAAIAPLMARLENRTLKAQAPEADLSGRN